MASQHDRALAFRALHAPGGRVGLRDTFGVRLDNATTGPTESANGCPSMSLDF